VFVCINGLRCPSKRNYVVLHLTSKWKRTLLTAGSVLRILVFVRIGRRKNEKLNSSLFSSISLSKFFEFCDFCVAANWSLANTFFLDISSSSYSIKPAKVSTGLGSAISFMCLIFRTILLERVTFLKTDLDVEILSIGRF